MVSILLTLNALVCAALIVLILLQRSDPNSGGMFGGASAGNQPVVRNPLAKPTAVLAALFLLFSIFAAVLNKGGSAADTVMTQPEAPATTAPATPALPEASLLGGAASPTAVPQETSPTTN